LLRRGGEFEFGLAELGLDFLETFADLDLSQRSHYFSSVGLLLRRLDFTGQDR
jgi:hypothetical protein